MIIGSHLIRKSFLKSSFDFMKLFFDTVPDGTAVLCDDIEDARGRGQRRWIVRKGQLLLTLALKFPIYTSDEIISASMALSCGVIESFKKFDVYFKWPNDVMYDGKKIAGILIEPLWEGARFKGLIVGIGSNINTIFLPEDELYARATSLFMISQEKIDQEDFLATLFGYLNQWYYIFLDKKYDHIYQQWHSHQQLKGQKINVHYCNGKVQKGIIHSFLRDGSLLLTTQTQICRIPFYIASWIEPL